MEDELLLGLTREEIEDFERDYRRLLTPDLIEYVDSLSDFNRRYFFAFLHNELGKAVDRRIIEGAKRRVMSGIQVLGEDELSPTPFKEAEKSISTHSWFGKSLVQRQFGA